MSFDDLQARWQAHDHGGPFDFDANRLMDEVRKNYHVLESKLWQRDLSEVIAAVLTTLVFATLAVLMGQWTLFLCAAGSLFVGLFLVLDRLKQRRRRSTIADSLQSAIDASLEQVQHQIWLLRNIFWWYLLPLVPGIVAFLASASWQSSGDGLVEQLVIASVGLICAIAFWYAYRINRREVIKNLEPRRTELEELRARIPWPT